MKLNITTGNTTPIYRQLINQFLQQFVWRTLKSGDSLPDIQRLAEELVINPNIVARAYQELSFLIAKKDENYFISDRSRDFSEKERLYYFRRALNNFLTETVRLGFSQKQIRDILRVTEKILYAEGVDK
jgi:GntR family transcriptional regulator